jgi:hypothetical protein
VKTAIDPLNEWIAKHRADRPKIDPARLTAAIQIIPVKGSRRPNVAEESGLGVGVRLNIGYQDGG